MISMDDVAVKAKVSKATVSRVLNGKMPVSPEVRAKVLHACKELNYRLNFNIQDLVLKSRNGTTRNIAFVLVGKEFADPAYARLIDGIAEEVNKYHYQLQLVKITGQESSVYDLPPVLRDVRVDGMLMSGAITSQTVRLVNEMNIQCVVIGNYSSSLLDGLSSVQFDIDCRILQALLDLKAQGCRKIAFAEENPDNYAAQCNHDAYRRALRELGMDYDPALSFWGRGAFSGISHELKPAFLLPELPFDGIFCPDYRLAEEVSHLACARFGFEPMAFRIATLRRSDYYKLPVPAVYIGTDNDLMVEAAFRQLVEQMEGRSSRRKIIVNE